MTVYNWSRLRIRRDRFWYMIRQIRLYLLKFSFSEILKIHINTDKILQEPSTKRQKVKFIFEFEIILEKLSSRFIHNTNIFFWDYFMFFSEKCFLLFFDWKPSERSRKRSDSARGFRWPLLFSLPRTRGTSTTLFGGKIWRVQVSKSVVWRTCYV